MRNPRWERMRKELRRDSSTARLVAIGPTKTYSALLAYAQRRGWRPGWAAFAFKEIFGGWPKDQHRRGACALPGFDMSLEKWVAHRKKRPRIKAKDAPPLLAEVEKPVVQVDASGFVAGSLMRPEDMEVDWR